ncbi:DUF6912 family protein [Allostreptomyces psammosilenae]|uniref:Uncharacterized protein n=1 Tax=Allostreptomyces psammosilenae TaxID=1892865 RepID=A0A852ZVB8_9ACTN|nr:hypothetical protein [Allostreptomyces psammosilenae]NYI06189.1 hypothetical protein [Allostreptomyces psammosilenae]
MRVYVPTTLVGLAAASAAGEIGPAPFGGFAVTDELRDWYGEGDEEEYEYAALSLAAEASLHLLAEDPGADPRRVVLAVEVAQSAVARPGELSPRAAAGTGAGSGAGEGEEEPGRVLLRGPVPLRRLAAVQVDAADARPVVTAAVRAVGAGGREGGEAAVAAMDAVADLELLWYAVQEIPELLAG